MAIKKRPLYVKYSGSMLLSAPLLNKGSAFSVEERINFNLEGLIPDSIETIEEQVNRAYDQYCAFEQDIDKHIYLRNMQDTNETLFYRLIQEHITEMMPIIYTPTVGTACERFSSIYRRERGLFLSYPNSERIEDQLNNATKRNVRVIVITDGERILGLGDQGIGGMGIPVGKLSLYTSCGGISPANTLPIVLDVGTNNKERLADPMYMGWRHPRIIGTEYSNFIEKVIVALQNRWPDALIQFEDFAQHNALPLLEKYRDRVCCFNDDIQGTAAVTVGSLLAACKAAGTRLSQQRIAFLGAGSAGCGIAEFIIKQMVIEGLTDAEARKKIFMLDSKGLISEQFTDITTPNFKADLSQKSVDLVDWPETSQQYDLLQVVENSKPTVLVGVSGSPGLFNESVIKAMYQHCKNPIVFPLSNPTSRIEGHPEDILKWTDGNALVATGSPFKPIQYKNKLYPIAQCNNSYIFPGVGLGVLAVQAHRVTDDMLMASSRALAECSPSARKESNDLLPPLSRIQQVSRFIAMAVAKQAIADGVASALTDDEILQNIDKIFWKPEYRQYKRVAF